MERALVVGSALYLLYVSVAMGGGMDPVLAFILIPLASLFLLFLEGCEWARANA